MHCSSFFFLKQRALTRGVRHKHKPVAVFLLNYQYVAPLIFHSPFPNQAALSSYIMSYLGAKKQINLTSLLKACTYDCIGQWIEISSNWSWRWSVYSGYIMVASKLFRRSVSCNSRPKKWDALLLGPASQLHLHTPQRTLYAPTSFWPGFRFVLTIWHKSGGPSSRNAPFEIDTI